MKNLPFNIYSGTRRATFALVVAAGGLAGCTDRPLQGVPLPQEPRTAGQVGGAAGAILGTVIGEAIDSNGYGGVYGGVYGAVLGEGLARDEAQRRRPCTQNDRIVYNPVTGQVDQRRSSGVLNCNQRVPNPGLSGPRLNFSGQPPVSRDKTEPLLEFPEVYLGS